MNLADVVFTKKPQKERSGRDAAERHQEQRDQMFRKLCGLQAVLKQKTQRHEAASDVRFNEIPTLATAIERETALYQEKKTLMDALLAELFGFTPLYGTTRHHEDNLAAFYTAAHAKLSPVLTAKQIDYLFGEAAQDFCPMCRLQSAIPWAIFNALKLSQLATSLEQNKDRRNQVVREEEMARAERTRAEYEVGCYQARLAEFDRL